LAGNFACGMASHAITDYEDAQPRVVTEIVFIMGANPSYVASSRYIECKGHSCNSLPSLIGIVRVLRPAGSH